MSLRLQECTIHYNILVIIYKYYKLLIICPHWFSKRVTSELYRMVSDLSFFKLVLSFVVLKAFFFLNNSPTHKNTVTLPVVHFLSIYHASE